MRNPLQALQQGFLNRRWRVRQFYNRLMLILWRVGLWRAAAPLYLILTTWGRKTRQPRPTVLMYQAVDDRIYILALWGQQSDWYQNVLADPHVTVQTAQWTQPAIARRVADDAEIADLFEQLGPLIRPTVTWYLRGLGYEPDLAGILANKERLHVLRLDPTDEPTPPPLKADLTWVLPLVLVGLAGIWLLRRFAR